MSELAKKLHLKAEIERTDKGMTAVASTSVEDRHGEVVQQDGWDIKNYKKNPVLQWAHDHTIPAIGMAKNVKVIGEGKKAQLTFEPVFHDITPEAKALKQLVEGTDEYPPMLNSFSVGFRPLEVDGNTYVKSELLEISLVNVPANADARIMAHKSLEKAGFSDDVIKSVGVWVDTEKSESVEDLRLVIDEIQKKNDDRYNELVKGLKHLNPEVRKEAVVTSRLALNKVIARATDKILQERPTSTQAPLLRVIKRANEKLIVDQKQELVSGKNQRPAG